MAKNFIIWLIIIVIFIFIFQNFTNFSKNDPEIDYSTFINLVNQNQIKKVSIYKNTANITYQNDNICHTYIPMFDSKLLDLLLVKNIKITGVQIESHSLIMSIFISCLPTIILFIIWILFLRQLSLNGKGALSFGKSKAKMLKSDQINISFNDVAGCDEAKVELMELVDYLKEPMRFKKLGGKIPKGILMIGPPGTGKTLLAKAVAGESKVPFFTISGSDFVEMFVGIGASRVRDMFNQAKNESPCIIFIDEIDAVGRKRGSGLGGGNDEREQTLNQMLVEMDGFDESNYGIIIIAATNRPDVLDPALLRPGRFDKQVMIDLPDIRGREQILKIHMRQLPLSNDVNISIIARGTPGFSGADLSNLVNESALRAARLNKNIIEMIEFEKSRDKIIMGLERKSIVLTEKQKEYTAYHEAGHVIVSFLVPEHDPVHKVTIIPRGKALGVTFFLPENDNMNVSRQKLESQISTLYGGRLAEKIIYGNKHISTGASNDIKIATKIARNMVTQWGFSEKLGPLLYHQDYEDILLGKSINQSKYISDITFRIIDKEIKSIIERNYNRAYRILKNNIDILHKMKDLLIEYETIDKLQINNLMNRK